MSKRKTKYYKKALDQLKTEIDVSEELKELNKYRSRLVRAVGKAIRDNDLNTVPEIKTLLHFDSKEIFDAINFLMKYGGLKLINKRGEYPQYSYMEVH